MLPEQKIAEGMAPLGGATGSAGVRGTGERHTDAEIAVMVEELADQLHAHGRAGRASRHIAAKWGIGQAYVFRKYIAQARALNAVRYPKPPDQVRQAELSTQLERICYKPKTPPAVRVAAILGMARVEHIIDDRANVTAIAGAQASAGDLDLAKYRSAMEALKHGAATQPGGAAGTGDGTPGGAGGGVAPPWAGEGSEVSADPVPYRPPEPAPGTPA